MKIKILLLIIFWSLAFFIIGVTTSKAVQWVEPGDYDIPPHTVVVNKDVKTQSLNDCTGKPYKILVRKSQKRMFILDITGCVIKSYDVRVGFNKGPKQCEGDKKTPEGIYKIKDKRDSKYERFLEIDYPRPEDLVKAEKLGCKPGNAIGIHYFNQDVMDKNTQYSGSNGCITVWNREEIREISRLAKVGMEVEIKE